MYKETVDGVGIHDGPMSLYGVRIHDGPMPLLHVSFSAYEIRWPSVLDID